MQELISLLTRERVQIERMLYRVTNLRNLLLGGQARFIAWASDEVGLANDELVALEVHRATCYQHLADRHLQLPDTFDWEALIALAGDADAQILTGLRGDISVLVAEMQGHLAACAELGKTGADATAATLAQLQGVDLSAAVSPTSTLSGHRHVLQSL